MNRNELVSNIANATGMSKSNVSTFLDAFVDSTTEALKSGEDLRLVGFGTFSVSHRKAMKGRNPRTGEDITIPASKRPKFKPGKQLVDSLN